MNAEPKRPYYNPLPAIIRKVEAALGVLVRFGRHGVYIIKRPSDEVMQQIKKV